VVGNVGGVADAVCTCCGTPADGRAVRLLSHPEVVICSPCLDWLVSQRERRIAGHGSAVRVLGTESVLVVEDVARAVDHYRRLGFAVSTPDAGAAVAERDGQVVRLVHHGGNGDAAAVLVLRVDDADQLASSWRLAGLEVHGPEEVGDGTRAGWHRDADGNVLRFTSPSGRR